jgi:hypothetical protein
MNRVGGEGGGFRSDSDLRAGTVDHTRALTAKAEFSR